MTGLLTKTFQTLTPLVIIPTNFRAMVEDARKALVKERLELELLRRQMERKRKEAEDAEQSLPVSVDPFRY